MSGFESFIPMAMSMATTVAKGVAQQDAQDSAAEARNAAIQAQYDQVAAQQAMQQRQQENLLARQQAAWRAQVGASGAGGDSGGSADAVLAGLADNSAQNITDSQQMAQYNLTQQALRNSNLLDAASSRGGLNSLLGSSGDSSSGNLGNMLSQGLQIFQSFYGS
jgi:hypothetical protein